MRGALLLSLALTLSTPASAAEEPVRVTTDTREYCSLLVARLSALPEGQTEPARSLGADGWRLCETGHVRAGVARLRRALRLAQAGAAH